MAKEKTDDIIFDKLANLNLDIPAHAHVDDVKPKKEPEPRPEKSRVGRSKKKDVPTVKTSFKIERDLHLALKQYCLLQEEEMATVVFERILKPYLEKKGFYPPRK